MKFNPIKRILYTDKGEIIKKLDCPYKVSFSEPVLDSAIPEHVCDVCAGKIVDTSGMAEEELIRLSRVSGHLCWKIDPSQQNLRIVYTH